MTPQPTQPSNNMTPQPTQPSAEKRAEAIENGFLGDCVSIPKARAELTAIIQKADEADELRNKLTELAETMTYRGDSVSYIYNKADNYKKLIDDCRKLFQMNGHKTVVDYIKNLIVERDTLKAENEKLREFLKTL